jgi:hypothetical protein
MIFAIETKVNYCVRCVMTPLASQREREGRICKFLCVRERGREYVWGVKKERDKETEINRVGEGETERLQ